MAKQPSVQLHPEHSSSAGSCVHRSPPGVCPVHAYWTPSPTDPVSPRVLVSVYASVQVKSLSVPEQPQGIDQPVLATYLPDLVT